ncbi:cyclic AMP-dependent transcription factor ATF-3-like isoform X2 [Glandiceps talaboti]
MRRHELTPEEEDRRYARREKNRLAAAKCRERQRDRADTLLKETVQLETQNNDLRQQIKKLNEEKEHLSFALSMHQLKSNVGNHTCKLKNGFSAPQQGHGSHSSGMQYPQLLLPGITLPARSMAHDPR